LSNPDTIETHLPLTLLTGFLGAGKTTLLNRYLKSEGAVGTAVLVNEFGEVDVDGAILGASMGKNQLMSLPNGCVCCEVQDDLAEVLLGLTERRGSEGIQRCVIETTGLADPGSILRGVAHDPRLKDLVSVAQTICVASAASISEQAENFVEAAEQIALADRVIITKSDLVETTELASVKTDLVNRNPLAEIMVAMPANAENLFNNPNRVAAVPQTHAHNHTHGISTFSVELSGAIDKDVFRDVLSYWIMRHAERLLRVKGILAFANDPKSQLMNITHDVCTIEPLDYPARPSPVVFIGIDLPADEIRRDLQRCIA
jgi:G3E family GTPase